MNIREELKDFIPEIQIRKVPCSEVHQRDDWLCIDIHHRTYLVIDEVELETWHEFKLREESNKFLDKNNG